MKTYKVVLKFGNFGLSFREDKVILFDEEYHEPISEFTIDEFDLRLHELAEKSGPRFIDRICPDAKP